MLTRHISEAVPELLKLFSLTVPPLLAAIEKFKSGYTTEEINKKCLALQEGYISFSAQLSESKANTQVLKEKIVALEEEVLKKDGLVEELQRDREKIVADMERSLSASEAKARGPAGKTDGPDGGQDLADVKAELERIKEERTFYVLAAEEKSEKIVKLQLELEVSEERFIKTKSFKSLISQSKDLLKQMESLKKSNEELQKKNEEFNDTKSKEIRAVMLKEEEKRSEVESQIKTLASRIISLEKEKEEAQTSLHMIRKEQINMKKSNNFKSIIEDLEEEKARLKKQCQELTKDKQELASRLEDEQRRVNECKDQLVLKEITLQKCFKEEKNQGLSDFEVEARLKEYKSELNEIKSQLKLKENMVSKLESSIRGLKYDIKTEKRNSETLLTEIEVTGNAYEETLKKNKALCAQLQFSEQNYNQLMNERIKEENWKSLLEKKQRSLEETIEAKENLINYLQDTVKEQELVISSRVETINQFDLKFRQLEQKFNQMNLSQVESNRRYEELLACKKEIQEKLKQAEKFCIKSATDCMQFRFLYENLQRTIKVLEENAANERDSFMDKATDQVYIAEIANYRRQVRCPQCKTRNKDCFLNKCLHMYCRKCIELNLSQRKRKCPACYTKFSSDDVRPFNWD